MKVLFKIGFQKTIRILDLFGILNFFWKKDDFYKIKYGYIFLSKKYNLSSWYRRFDIWEPKVFSYLENLKLENKKILEFGSCFGYFSILFSKKTLPKGKIIGIEPFPEYFKMLEKTRRKNKFKNLEFLNFGINDENSKISFDPSCSIYDSMLIEINKKDKSKNKKKLNKVQVPVYNLKETINIIKFTPDLIFMDIEGIEEKVFDQILKNKFFQTDIIFESHLGFYKNTNLKKILEDFQKIGYKVKKIDKNHYHLSKNNFLK